MHTCIVYDRCFNYHTCAVADGPGSSTIIVFQAMTMILLPGKKKRETSLGILGILETNVCEH